MQRLKFPQQRRQSPPAEGKRRSDTQKSARGVAPASSLYLCLVNIGEKERARTSSSPAANRQSSIKRSMLSAVPVAELSEELLRTQRQQKERPIC
jgi:hypothetical protein